MEEQNAADDQSHYEISLTAGQAFVAFVLLLLSLAAAFAFGLMIGKGQADERLVVRKESPTAITEGSLAPKKSEAQIVELGPAEDDFVEPVTESAAPATTTTTDVTTTATIIEEAPTATPAATAGTPAPVPATAAPAPASPAPVLHVTTYAQLLSTGDQRTAESLAARLIDRGFTTAYVERGTTDKGPVYRVRVKFDSESEARASEAKLKQFSKEVWITTK